MARVIRVTGAWTGLLSDWLDQEGLDAGPLRMALARWASRDNVPVPVWRDLLSQGLALVPGRIAPELGVGACVLPGHVGVLGYLVLASDTLGEAMLAYQRYETLFYGASLAEIEVVGDQAEMRWPPSENELGQQADGAAIAALVTFMRRQIDQPPPPSTVSFLESVDGETARAYESFFDCPVTWNDSHVRVRFPLHYLSLPMPRRDPTLRELLDRQARALVRALPEDSGGSSSTDRQLQQVLLKLLSDGEPTLARAASAMHMAPRTLQRRLARHQLSWQQWLDRSREQLARQYLADPSLTLTDIALLLGFSEQSAFTRAYRRWTGNSPGKARPHQLSD
ncbi:AraC family transcriptional regulator [Marinobacter sp. SS13-12]|uniref:helix-turn-helix transcriptional regulator n=1 Tax=Marinobacter sp. SS13-12 TaxID=3050451 RepID=UPI002553A8B8|nr:AraC family transcriptional regulator [Marinobacter sp. SS13-12]MDK8462875.1 AraC family transcriptional regulator ligand-binding domain-containing protein [Marinobacter sp. SS13-12]